MPFLTNHPSTYRGNHLVSRVAKLKKWLISTGGLRGINLLCWHQGLTVTRKVSAQLSPSNEVEQKNTWLQDWPKTTKTQAVSSKLQKTCTHNDLNVSAK